MDINIFGKPKPWIPKGITWFGGFVNWIKSGRNKQVKEKNKPNPTTLLLTKLVKKSKFK
jgi:hypothetical protein